MASVSDVFDIAAAFLDAAVTALEQTAAGPPDRQFVAPGEPALDCCGQLAVWTQSISEVPLSAPGGALARAKQINRGNALTVNLAVQVTRCIAVSRVVGGKPIPPSPAQQQADAQTIDEDGWALWLGMAYALKHGSLHEICSGAERVGAQKMTPQGECAGWIFGFRYPIEGGVLGP